SDSETSDLPRLGELHSADDDSDRGPDSDSHFVVGVDVLKNPLVDGVIDKTSFDECSPSQGNRRSDPDGRMQIEHRYHPCRDVVVPGGDLLPRDADVIGRWCDESDLGYGRARFLAVGTEAH